MASIDRMAGIEHRISLPAWMIPSIGIRDGRQAAHSSVHCFASLCLLLYWLASLLRPSGSLRHSVLCGIEQEAVPRMPHARCDAVLAPCLHLIGLSRREALLLGHVSGFVMHERCCWRSEHIVGVSRDATRGAVLIAVQTGARQWLGLSFIRRTMQLIARAMPALAASFASRVTGTDVDVWQSIARPSDWQERRGGSHSFPHKGDTCTTGVRCFWTAALCV